MSKTSHKIIYQERYETFRHLDRLRWQLPTLALTGGSIFLSLSTTSVDPIPPWWAILLFGVLCAISAYAVQRIRDGSRANSRVLSRVGKEIGDSDIPVSERFWGATTALTLFLWGLSIASFIFSYFRYS